MSHGHRIEHIDDPGPLKVPGAVSIGLMGLGALGVLASLAMGFSASEKIAARDAWAGIYVASVFYFFLAMGASFFLAVNYVAGAKWFVAIKRVPESIAQHSLPAGLIVLAVTIFGASHMYPWHYEPEKHHLAEGSLKLMWLSLPLHYVKMAAYLLPLVALSQLLVRHSVKQDETRSESHSTACFNLGIAFLICFGVFFSLFSWESLMSFTPKWFSTMFGVYCFAGAFVSALALSCLVLRFVKGPAKYVAHRHEYDLGTYVMAFSTFMIYVGFSQFMLIWYANIPEETFFYQHRYGGWLGITIALPVLRWIIPFLVLMPPPFRTNPLTQTFVCLCILAGQLLDLYWIVFPSYYPTVFHAPNAATLVALAGGGLLMLGSILNFLGKHSLIATGDPKLMSSVNGDYLHA